MARILLHPFGSFGDLHPFLRLALGLRERGHHLIIAASEVYRQKILAEGVEFAAVRPDIGRMLDRSDLLAKVWDARRGTEYLLREVIFPALEQSYEDLFQIAGTADLLITHTAAYAGPLAAEKLGKRWLSVALQPMVFFSKFDPPLVGPAQWLRPFYRLGTLPFALLRRIADLQTARWAQPVAALRRKIGLPQGANPILRGQFSPFGTLALFSHAFAQPQPDWPPHTKLTGFLFYDRLGAGFDNEASDGVGMRNFLADGPPPIVFTLGSSAVMHPGSFFRESIRAVQSLDARAVLVAGPDAPLGLPPGAPSKHILVTGYAPYGELLPQASAIVHQGGIGTTAQALRAGKPMLVVPFAHDQPDNAERLRRLGVARTLARSRYTAEAAARALRTLLDDSKMAAAAAALGAEVRSEDGVSAACAAVENALRPGT